LYSVKYNPDFKSMTRKKWVAIFILIICGIMIFSFIRFWNGHADVASGHIAYTYNCGWVDWKHARPGNIKAFVNDFSEKFAQTPLNESFKITYGQKGGFNQMGYSIFSYSISREYEVLKLQEDAETKKQLMFQIFRDVSYLFEAWQKKVFWGILKSSAFREGDLMGNLIGFYIACGDMTQEEASELCEELPISISLQLEREGKFKVNNSLMPKYRIIPKEGDIPTFPKRLMRYNNLENCKNCISPLDETETISFLGNTDIGE
jgi:hypothetical protein